MSINCPHLRRYENDSMKVSEGKVALGSVYYYYCEALLRTIYSGEELCMGANYHKCQVIKEGVILDEDDL